MNLKKLAIVGLLLVVGCKKVIREEPVGNPFQREEAYSCQHFGYCYGMSVNGKYEFGVSAFCPGTQTNTEVAQRYHVWYDDKTEGYETWRVRTIEEGACL